MICIGNLVVGGTGKTPTAITLAKLLIKKGKSPAFVSKGYKGTFSGTIKVESSSSPQIVGDEALLLARIAPCYVCKNRATGIQKAIEDGANMIILDDGMHDRSVNKDLTFMIIDGTYGLGNGFLLPAGPLRNNLSYGISQCDYAVIIGQDIKNIQYLIHKKVPILEAKISVNEHTAPEKNSSYVAFAGIGNPAKFFTTLHENGYIISKEIYFPDHHYYSDKEIEELIELAKNTNSKLITTTKDLVKINNHYTNNISILPINIHLIDEEKISQILEPLL